MENLLSIGQAAKMLACSQSRLRYYEKEFSMEIPRDAHNRRMYGKKELESLRYIAKLKDQGENNAHIKAVLQSGRIEIFTFDPQDEEVSAQTYEEAKEKSAEEKDMASLLYAIGQLRDEINELRRFSQFESKDALIEENETLKRKLKEKTYELVETREKLKYSAPHKKEKRGLFR